MAKFYFIVSLNYLQYLNPKLPSLSARLHRVMVNFFEQRKKITLKWLANCERKERQVKPDVKELKDSKSEYIKVKVCGILDSNLIVSFR